MEVVARPSPASPIAPRRPRRIDCVSFLNSKPLIDGLEDHADPVILFDVPSRLLADLETDEADIALCPVIDYQRSAVPLALVPVGGIGCRGPTFTVRLFSRVPFDQLAAVHADTDSHTSVALLRVLLAERWGIKPRIIDLDTRAPGGNDLTDKPALLLIGDKVVTAAPSAEAFPHQMDLGQGWFEHTGMPFVFAVWMCRTGRNLGDIPALLAQTRQRNRGRIAQIAARYAPLTGWPADLAQRYLGQWLRYEVGAPELAAIARFHASAHRLGLIPGLRPLVCVP